jgi:hypothetical protein
MKIKEGASLQGLDIRMRPVLIVANQIWRVHGQELVITSGTDGAHSAGSLHYYGRAVDLRIRDFDAQTVSLVFVALKKELDDLGNKYISYYDVVQHKTHIHAEYDPRKGS